MEMLSLTENGEPGTSETQPNKRRRKKSIVWEHFTVESAGPECTRACCKQCKQTFAYSTGTKLSGTSHLKRHIAMGTCLANRRKEKNQLKSSASRSNGNGTVTNPPRRSSAVNFRLDQELNRHLLAEMIIMHDYPLQMVEHAGFIRFIKTLQPHFNLVDVGTVQADCIAIYHKEKRELVELLGGIPGRISLSVDLWTSTETMGYVFLTAHFINSAWKLHSRILNVVMVPFPQSGDNLSQAVETCLGEWGLKNKLFSLTLNKSVFGDYNESLRGYFSLKNPLVLNGHLLMEHCYSQVLTSIVQDALEGMQETINKVRESMKYVKTSQGHEHKFLELKQKLQVPSSKFPFLDDQTRWNTSYFMLEAALELKEVFGCLDTADPDYQLTLTMEDWKQLDTLCTYLKLLYGAANVVTSTRYATADLFFHEAWKIQFDLICGGATQDPFISNLTIPLREKFDAYWKDCSLILSIAVVLDPQFKMKLVECCFAKIYGDESTTYVEKVDEGIHELFSEYVLQFLPLASYLVDQGNIINVKIEEQFDVCNGDPPADDFFDCNVFMSDLSASHITKSELDQYLEEPVVDFTQDFDILRWWDINSLKYPALSKMARDILAIPVSVASPECVFSVGCRELDRYRSSLQPETVQALICAKDWLRYGSTNAKSSVLKTELLCL